MLKKLLLTLILIPLFLLQGCTEPEEYTLTPDSDLVGDHEQTEPEETEVYEPGLPYIRIQFAGDILIHAAPIEVARTGEHTFDFRPFLRDIKPFIDGDLAIANLEVPVDAHGNNQNPTGWPLFNAPFEILEAAEYAGFNHLITANNHAFDQGWSGLVNTVASLERAGIAHTGMSVDMEDFNRPTILDVNGIQVGIIAYTDSVNGLENLVPESSRAYAVRRFRSHNLDSIPAMTEDIAHLREAGAELVIVSLHWGAEYEDAPRETQRTIARALGEAGADVIMGHHSHTVHPIEWHYRADGTRTLIIYSLGNFLADQTRLTEASVESQLNASWNHHQFIGRTQFGMLLNLQVIRELDGSISLGTVDVLPTLCMRDFSGNTLGVVDGVSVMPLINGELPDFVMDEELRHWGRVAYEHVVSIVGEQFIAPFGSATSSD